MLPPPLAACEGLLLTRPSQHPKHLSRQSQHHSSTACALVWTALQSLPGPVTACVQAACSLGLFGDDCSGLLQGCLSLHRRCLRLERSFPCALRSMPAQPHESLSPVVQNGVIS